MQEEPFPPLLEMEVNDLEVEERSYPPWPRSSGRKACGRADGEGSSTRRGESKSLKCIDGNKSEYVQDPSCATRDLGIQRPQWHTLLFEEQVAVDMRVVRRRCCQSKPGWSVGRSGQQSTSARS